MFYKNHAFNVKTDGKVSGWKKYFTTSKHKKLGGYYYYQIKQTSEQSITKG